MKKFLTKMLVVVMAPAAATMANAATDASAEGDVRSMARAALDDPAMTDAAQAAIAGSATTAVEDAAPQAGDLWPSVEPAIQVI